MVTRLFGLGVVVLTLLAVAPESWAQPGRGPGAGGPGFGGGDPLSILRLPSVRDEVGILDEQQEEIDSLSREMREEMTKEVQAVQQRLAAKYKSKLEQVLLPHQVERIEQIQIQQQGMRALTDSDIAKRLGVSDEQVKKLTEIQDGMRDRLREAFQNREEGSDPREMFQKLMTDVRTEMEGVLSADQLKKFEQMKGEPVDLTPQRGNFPGRRFQGRGQRGPGRPSQDAPSNDETF